MGRRNCIKAGLSFAVWLLATATALAQAQNVPSPSQVAPPVIAPPTGGGRITLPQVPAGATVPAQAKKLSFKLLGFDVQGEFEELAAARKELAAPLIGRCGPLRLSFASVLAGGAGLALFGSDGLPTFAGFTRPHLVPPNQIIFPGEPAYLDHIKSITV